MYRVGVKHSASVSHFLVGDFGEETVPHSHDYTVEWVCQTDDLDEHGFSVDIAAMEEILSGLLSELEGVLLNDMPYFESTQPSVENFARFVFDKTVDGLRARGMNPGLRSGAEILVWESPTAWASYRDSR